LCATVAGTWQSNEAFSPFDFFLEMDQAGLETGLVIY